LQEIQALFFKSETVMLINLQETQQPQMFACPERRKALYLFDRIIINGVPLARSAEEG
jgi:hypothetical protein